MRLSSSLIYSCTSFAFACTLHACAAGVGTEGHAGASSVAGNGANLQAGASALAGSSGGGSPQAGASGTAGTSSAAGSGAGPSYAATVQPLFTSACNCHQTTPFLMAPFSLKPGEAFANLVNAQSMQTQTMVLVKPGDLNASYLWHKVNGTQLEVGGMGRIMPSTIPLNAEERAIVERWIAGGALP